MVIMIKINSLLTWNVYVICKLLWHGVAGVQGVEDRALGAGYHRILGWMQVPLRWIMCGRPMGRFLYGGVDGGIGGSRVEERESKK